MRAASSELITFLNTIRAEIDAPIVFADCFTFRLINSVTLYDTNLDFPVVYNGNTFSASGPMVQGLKFKSSIGLEVDTQQITIAARPTDVVSGAMFLQMIRDGALDGAVVQRDRVFFSGPGVYGFYAGPPPGFSSPSVVVGGVTLFHGRVATVDSVGRTSAQITVASDLVILDYDMPRNLYSATCLHVLFDSGCGLSAAAHSTNVSALAGSTAILINCAGASANHVQGKIIGVTGANAGVQATVQSAVPGTSLTLIYPLPETPAYADEFIVYSGCDHTQATCNAKFANIGNFRGFPYVPPAQIAY